MKRLATIAKVVQQPSSGAGVAAALAALIPMLPPNLQLYAQILAVALGGYAVIRPEAGTKNGAEG